MIELRRLILDYSVRKGCAPNQSEIVDFAQHLEDGKPCSIC